MRKGFTLVELSIVLVIIGLLIGGVLKGKAMIENSKVKKVKTDVDGIVSALNTFQDKYKYLPGDSNITIGSVRVTNGNGNGIIDSGEELNAWKLLVADGIMSGNPAGLALANVAKKTPYGGVYSIVGDTANPVIITTSTIPNEAIQQLDIYYDDGAQTRGDINSTVAYGTTGQATMKWDAF